MKKLLFIALLLSQLLIAQKEMTHEVYFETDKFEVRLKHKVVFELDVRLILK